LIRLGEFNTLKVSGTHRAGALLDDGEEGELLLKGEHELSIGDAVEAFIYRDAEGDLAATTRMPLAAVGQVAWMKIVTVNQYGAFADWGLAKDLFIPFGEQQHELRSGNHALVRVYLDNQDRISGSTKLNRWVEDIADNFKPGQKVSLIIADRTELGFKAVINHQAWGLLYNNELTEPVHKGQSIDGYVKQLRGDGKVDLILTKPGYTQSKIDVVADDILAKLAEHDGHLLLSDKSPPEAIQAVFGVSKKVFKQALGALYKQRRVELDGKSIRLKAD
jgi:predicted RNA-binding protein (virulence factor B family)